LAPRTILPHFSQKSKLELVRRGLIGIAVSRMSMIDRGLGGHEAVQTPAWSEMTFLRIVISLQLIVGA
jgi:hypothetical protein